MKTSSTRRYLPNRVIVDPFGGLSGMDGQGRAVLEINMSVNEARELATWLNVLADEIDSDYTDGYPMGYAVSARCA